MNMTLKLSASIALLSFAICIPASAQEITETTRETTNTTVQIDPVAIAIIADIASAETPAVLVQPDEGLISNEDLIALRGGQAIVLSNQALTAISNGNVFNGDYVAGQISLTDNALSNFNGMGNFVINTGAQNNLQSAMNVTINIAQ
jgi:hypothetical protein